MAELSSNPYTVLGLDRGASAATIKQAYFTLVRTHPPEREPETFKRIRAAYERLRDPQARLETDMLLPLHWTPPARQRRAPTLDLTLHAEDVLEAAAALTDLARTDWHAYHHKVKL